MLGSQLEAVKWTQGAEKRGNFTICYNCVHWLVKAPMDLPETGCSRTIHAPVRNGVNFPP